MHLFNPTSAIRLGAAISLLALCSAGAVSNIADGAASLKAVGGNSPSASPSHEPVLLEARKGPEEHSEGSGGGPGSKINSLKDVFDEVMANRAADKARIATGKNKSGKGKKH